MMTPAGSDLVMTRFRAEVIQIRIHI